MYKNQLGNLNLQRAFPPKKYLILPLIFVRRISLGSRKVDIVKKCPMYFRSSKGLNMIREFPEIKLGQASPFGGRG